jgi:hypothetical protein
MRLTYLSRVYKANMDLKMARGNLGRKGAKMGDKMRKV